MPLRCQRRRDRVRDPVWRLPFWDPYEALIEPGIADLDNAPSGGMAGSITAALFLRRFVDRLPALPAFRHLRMAADRGAGPAQGRRRTGGAGAARCVASAAGALTDPRTTAFSGRVADVALSGKVTAEAFVTPQARQVAGNPFLLRDPGGRRDRQLLTGDDFGAIETRGGWTFGQAAKDGYCGWLPAAALVAPVVATHRVSVRTTWPIPSRR